MSGLKCGSMSMRMTRQPRSSAGWLAPPSPEQRSSQTNLRLSSGCIGDTVVGDCSANWFHLSRSKLIDLGHHLRQKGIQGLAQGIEGFAEFGLLDFRFGKDRRPYGKNHAVPATPAVGVGMTGMIFSPRMVDGVPSVGPDIALDGREFVLGQEDFNKAVLVRGYSGQER